MSDVVVYDLVGAAEAAEVLGIPVPHVTRMANDEKMPPLATAQRLAMGPVWHRPDVAVLSLALREHRDRPTFDPNPLPLLGLSEVASRLKRDKSVIGRWRRKGRFPEPAAVVRSGPLWVASDVDAFQP